jgi:iron complex transport system substrate-binding protein
VPSQIERVVSLAPNMTEIIFAIGAGERLVGNTNYCDYPSEAKNVQKVGDTLQPNIERIIALRAQLVLVSTASQLEAFTRQMEQQNIPIYVSDPKDFEGVLRTIATVGELLGKRDEAQKVVNDMRSRSSAVDLAVKSRKPVTVFYQVSREPLYTAGRDAFITDLIRMAGGRSVTADVPGAWPKYSDESALASQPEAIVMASFDSMGKDNMKVADALKDSPAVKNGRVFGINGDFLSRPGPRLVNGLEEMAKRLHPDAFK